MEFIQKMYNQTIEKHNASIAKNEYSQEVKDVLEEAAQVVKVKPSTRASTRLSVAAKRATVTSQKKSTAAAKKVSGQRKLTTISPFELQTEKRAKYAKDMDF